MARTCTCTERLTPSDPQCQDRAHPNGLHHAHDTGRCLMWADSANQSNRPVWLCEYPPAHEVEARAERIAAKAEALIQRDGSRGGPTGTVRSLRAENAELRARLAKVEAERDRQLLAAFQSGVEFGAQAAGESE